MKGEAEEALFVLLRDAVVEAVAKVEERSHAAHGGLVLKDMDGAGLCGDEEALGAVASAGDDDGADFLDESLLGAGELVGPLEIREGGHDLDGEGPRVNLLGA